MDKNEINPNESINEEIINEEELKEKIIEDEIKLDEDLENIREDEIKLEEDVENINENEAKENIPADPYNFEQFGGEPYAASTPANTTQSNTPQPTKKKSKYTPEQMKIRKRKGLERGLCIITSAGLLFMAFLVACFLMFFPRSTKSVIEKRDLATFPTFSIGSYLSGEFTAGITNYYDDTVPFRDTFKMMGSNLKSLFGVETPNNGVVVGGPLKKVNNGGTAAPAYTENTGSAAQSNASSQASSSQVASSQASSESTSSVASNTSSDINNTSSSQTSSTSSDNSTTSSSQTSSTSNTPGSNVSYDPNNNTYNGEVNTN